MSEFHHNAISLLDCEIMETIPEIPGDALRHTYAVCCVRLPIEVLSKTKVNKRYLNTALSVVCLCTCTQLQFVSHTHTQLPVSPGRAYTTYFVAPHGVSNDAKWLSNYQQSLNFVAKLRCIYCSLSSSRACADKQSDKTEKKETQQENEAQIKQRAAK